MGRVRTYWWFPVVFGLTALLVTQFWSGNYVRQHVEHLNELLDDAHELSIGLSRAIGYGGLIHQFKNQVLRPDDPTYTDKARANAARALTMLNALEYDANRLGVSTSLRSTRRMIAAYTERLSRLPALVEQGLTSQEVDALVRFDDQKALNEIDALLSEIRQAVHQQINEVSGLGNNLFWFSSVTMAVLALILLKQLLNRRRDLQAIEQLNVQLSESVERLEASNIALRQFAGIVSHDLKAPLRHIGFFGTLISEDLENANPDEVKKHITSIDSAIGRMDNLIEGLLDFTRTGFAEPRLAPVDLRRIADDALHELRPLIERSGAVVSLSLSETINADTMLLSRVFENLIGNSIKYARQGVPPRIEIQSTTDDKFLHLSFTDNGIGIPAKDAERVFEPFQRLHGSRENYEGNGIGLALVKTVIEAHAGAVRIDTDYTDGTRFVISLLKTPVTTEQLREKPPVRATPS